MGWNQSKSKQTTPEPLLKVPWRKINWTDKAEPLQYIKNYMPPIEGHNIRIVLYGPAGAGKSSFVNSIQSVLLGRMYNLALVDRITKTGFTRKFSGYKVQKELGSYCPLVLYDMMGLEGLEGVLVDDVKLVLDGHVKDGYTFDPHCKLSEDNKFYNKSPTARDKVNVLVCVVPADKGPVITTPEILVKIREIRKEATKRDIPQMVVLTKIDELCPEVQENLQNVYRHKSLKQKMEQFSADTGIPMNCIFPVKNYHKEINLDQQTDSLVLSALRSIINAGGDHCQWTSSQPN